MKTYLLALFAVSLSMPSCSYNVDVTKDPRFKGIAPGQAFIKQRLRLYDISYRTTGSDNRYDLTTIDRGEQNLIAYIPAGQPVMLTRIYRHNDIGGDSEYVEGELIMKGYSYRFVFYLGSSAYPNKWRRIFELFEKQ